jgi:hypothetical protein
VPLDLFRLFLVEAHKLFSTLPSARRISSSLRWIAWVSRCSARWITRVMNQVAIVAIACQSRVPGLKINHAAAYAARIRNAA